jgi:small subunit ribosomal protein S5
MKQDRRLPPDQTEQEQRVISVDRVARVVKGGRRFRFRALVVIGDGKGEVGVGTNKATDVSNAVAKAVSQGAKDMIKLNITENGSIAYAVTAKFAGASVMLKPAKPGTGVIAGGAVRDVLEVAGITNIVSKRFGSSNKLNNARATISALKQLIPDNQVDASNDNKQSQGDAPKEQKPVHGTKT